MFNGKFRHLDHLCILNKKYWFYRYAWIIAWELWSRGTLLSRSHWAQKCGSWCLAWTSLFFLKIQLLVEVRCWLHYKFTTQLESLVRVDSCSIRHEFIMTRWIIMRLLNYGSIICCRILKIWIGVHDLEVIMQALLLAILLGETGSCLLAPPVLLSVSVLMNQQLRYAPKIWIMGFKTG